MEHIDDTSKAQDEREPVQTHRDDILSVVGRFADDPTLSSICDDAYRIRDEERERCRQSSRE